MVFYPTYVPGSYNWFAQGLGSYRCETDPGDGRYQSGRADWNGRGVAAVDTTAATDVHVTVENPVAHASVETTLLYASMEIK
jgi:hypothetical protein